MRAERDEDLYSRPASKPHERRLAYEIALGIWIGGTALVASSYIGWAIAELVMSGSIRLG